MADIDAIGAFTLADLSVASSAMLTTEADGAFTLAGLTLVSSATATTDAITALTLAGINVAGAMTVPLLPGTSAWRSAARHPQTLAGLSAGYSPIYVAQFVAHDFAVSNATVSGLTTQLWLARLNEGGLSGLQQQLDEQTLTARLSGGDVTLLTVPALQTALDVAPLPHAPVQLWLGFDGLPFTDYVPLLYGIVDHYAALVEQLTITFVEATVKDAVNLSTPLGGQWFPGTPQAFRSAAIPILVGGVTHVPLLPVVYGPAVGTLARAMDTSSTTIRLREIALNFPTTGTVLIESESIAYTTQAIINQLGISYLELGGLTRGAPDTHAAGVAVARTNLDATVFLVGYGDNTVNQVHDAHIALGTLGLAMTTGSTSIYLREAVLDFPAVGTVLIGTESIDYTSRALATVSSVVYTEITGLTRGTPATHDIGATVTRESTVVDASVYTVSTTMADRLVTLVTLEYAPADPGGLTGTVNAASLDQTNLLTNGDFETGTNSGWTLDGATLTVGTTAPVPFEATYRGALTGGLATWGRAYQDLTTVPGEVYDFRLTYQNQRATSVVSNSSFESGALSPWATRTVFSGAVAIIAGGTDGVKLLQASYSGVPASLLTNASFESALGAEWVRSGEVDSTVARSGLSQNPDGDFVVTLTETSSPPPYLDYFYGEMRQDFTTVIGTTYVLTFAYLTLYHLAITGHFVISKLFYRLGTTSNEQSLIADTEVGLTHTIGNVGSPPITIPSPDGTVYATVQGVSNVNPAYAVPVYLPFRTFVATATTTRVTFRLYVKREPANPSGSAGAPYGVYDKGPFLDHVLVFPFRTGMVLASPSWTTTQTQVQLPYFPFSTVYETRLHLAAPQFYSIDVYQDFTTTVSQDYVFSFQYRTGRDTITHFSAPLQRVSSLTYGLGTTSNETLYVGATTLAASHTYVDGVPTGPQPVLTHSPSHAFTATTTTTRVWFTLTGRTEVLSGTTPPPVNPDGTPLYPPFVVELDAVDVIADTAANNSQADYQIGTTTDPTLYQSAALPLIYGWSTVEGSFVPDDTTTRFAIRSQYSGTSFPTFLDDVSVTAAFSFASNTGGRNPVDVLLYMLNTFRPGFRFNSAHFTAARQTLAAWKVGAYLSAPGDLDERLQRLAFEVGSLLFRDATGAYDLIVLDDTRPTVFECSEALNMIEGTATRTSGPNDAVYTSFYVYYGAKTGGSTDPADFAGVTYVTRTETSHPNGGSLKAKCALAYALYGKERRYDLFAEWIQDFGTANLFLAWLVGRFTVAYDLIDFQTFLDAIPVRVGQVIRVAHQVNAHGRAIYGEVTSWQHQPGETTVALQVRVLKAAPGPPPVAEDITILSGKNQTEAFTISQYVTFFEGAVGDWATLDLNETLAGVQQSRVIASVGTFAVQAVSDTTFAPVADYLGVATTGYQVQDNAGVISNIATITITYVEAPVAAPIDETTAVNTPLTFDVGDSITIVNGYTIDDWTTLVIDPLVHAAQGTYSYGTGGNVTFTPVTDFTGAVGQSTYSVRDNRGVRTNISTLDMTVGAAVDQLYGGYRAINGMGNGGDPVTNSLVDAMEYSDGLGGYEPPASHGRTINWATLTFTPLSQSTWDTYGATITPDTGGDYTFDPGTWTGSPDLSADYTVEDDLGTVSIGKPGEPGDPACRILVTVL